MLSLITWAPFAGALVVLCLPKEKVKAIQAAYLNPEDVLNARSIVFLVDAIKIAQDVFGGAKKEKMPKPAKEEKSEKAPAKPKTAKKPAAAKAPRKVAKKADSAS